MELVVFVVTALIALVGAGAMLVSRNAVHSALFLLLNFGAIAVLYLLLQAPFLLAAGTFRLHGKACTTGIKEYSKYSL